MAMEPEVRCLAAALYLLFVPFYLIQFGYGLALASVPGLLAQDIRFKGGNEP